MRRNTDDQLIAGAADGDSAAFNGLVERYKGLVYAMAYGQVGRHDDASDVAQAVFLSVFVNLPSLADRSRFRPWLRTITVNAARAHLRGAREHVGLDDIDPMGIAPDEVGPLLRRLAVEQALRCLSEPTRLTITLYYFGSHSLSEIASFLDIPVSTVKSRLRDGRLRLKKEMIMMMDETGRAQAPDSDFASKVAALIEASIRGRTDTARSLLLADASLVEGWGGVAEEHQEHMRAADADHGWTPLHLAAHYGNLEIVMLLIDHGADVEAVAQNAIGNTPISAAAWGNHLDIVAYLLDCGAQVDAPNAWGATALHRAVDADRLPLAELLLSRGADPRARDKSGQTPLDIARREGRSALVELLGSTAA